MARQQLSALEAAGGGGVADALRDVAACSTIVGGAGLSADSALNRLLAVGAHAPELLLLLLLLLHPSRPPTALSLRFPSLHPLTRPPPPA